MSARFFKINNNAISWLALTIVAVLVASCVKPLYEPNKEARRVTAQLVQAAHDQGNILSDNSLEGYDLNLFPIIYRNIQDQYVYTVDGQALLLAAIEGVQAHAVDEGSMDRDTFDEVATQSMLASLDDYSTYMDAKAYRSFMEQTRGAYAGLGIQISNHEKGLLVVSPFEGSPADQVGILPGDVITHADGKALAELSMQESINLLRGRVGTSVVVTVERENSESFNASIRRDIIELHPVRHEIEGEVGYIRISNFSEGVGSMVVDAINDIERKVGEDKLYGYVLDLRKNPGGLLTEAVSVSSAFLSQKLIVSTRERDGENSFDSGYGEVADGKPVVVLIDEGSASASEIVAGALQDHERAALLGQPTFGKGSVQSVFPLYEGGVKLTTALYFTPSGRTVNGGIQPQYIVTDDPDEDGDEQLTAAYRLVVELAGGPNLNWTLGSEGQ
ncbi:S41 family peptidase [Curvivirga sp.]|uniref:S41 family peptidase n=1 Tax=Curvivirga sp. TaxID=2856848 RepID=UPI003B5C98F7